MKKVVLLSCKDNNFYNFRSELIFELQKRFEVVLVCPYGKKIDYFTNKGIGFINLSIDRRGKNVFKDLQLIRNYKRILKAEKPDVVLTFTSKPSFYGAFVCKKLNIPCIINNAGLAEYHGLMKRLFNFLYKHCENKANCIMFQNTAERDYVQNLLKWKTPYKDIPGSGVNLDVFSYSEYPKNDDIIILNYVARIVKIKGIDEFLECTKMIKEKYSNVEFRIFGDFDDDKYKAIINDYEERGIIKYYGVQLDMKPWIEQCHAAIHPSYYEGMTNVVLEHSAMGRPCLGSNIAGVKEAIDDGVTGFVFDVKNVTSLVLNVEKFLSLTNSEKTQMGKHARLKMKKEFDRQFVTEAYLSVINKVINK